ncbi:MAG TPA: hypothetical protein VL155_16470 [Terriglobales bacterium]|jgi:hypothetical protein|nr:hypothetical protein [Terriglobales bacterium]
MERTLEPIRVLADVMNYLDRAYCRGSIVEWVRTAPEGAAYSIVRQIFVQVVEESGRTSHLLQAA